jgi:hypothetical protein
MMEIGACLGLWTGIIRVHQSSVKDRISAISEGKNHSIIEGLQGVQHRSSLNMNAWYSNGSFPTIQELHPPCGFVDTRIG